ncbi:MAG: efflux RND transporter periplasmic adaptor subunit [Candidatus Eiseniibacteriota bacterium]
MAKRMRLMLLIVGLFIAAIGTFKFLQIRAAIAQGSSWQPPPETVTSIVAKEEDWPATLTAIGSVEAVHGVLLSADLAGVVREINFESGRRVAKGQVLVRLDTSQEQAQLAQVQASRDLAELNLKRAQKLVGQGVIAQSEFDRMQAEARETVASVDVIEATIGRKTIRAPFSGAIGIRQIDLGQRLNEGDPIVQLQTLDPVYVSFSLPQTDMDELRVGSEVRISGEGLAGAAGAEEGLVGRITAINSLIDVATRNVAVQATLRNPREHLRPGMFVDVSVDLGRASRAISLPASAVAFAPYGNSVFVIETLKDPKGKAYKGVSQRFVKLGQQRGDQVAVVSGVKPGEEVVTSGAFKLRPGAAVVVDNKVQPANDPAPKPADS